MKAPASGAVARFGSLFCYLIVSLVNSHAGSATWNANPANNDWNTATNWTPGVVPDEVATFGVSNTTKVSVSGPSTSIGEIAAGTISRSQSCRSRCS
jgi:hypothetical protein